MYLRRTCILLLNEVVLKNYGCMPWLVWLSGLSASL